MDPDQRERVITVAGQTGGVISRSLLSGLGVTHDHVRHELDAGRWTRLGTQTLLPHRGQVTDEGRRWRAVWETGPRIALLDGVTALQAAGLRHFDEADVHVSVLHRHTVGPSDGVRIHSIIRRVPGEAVGAGVPRTRPPVAALRAAYWASSDRQAALVLLMTVQQRLATPAQLVSWSGRLRGRRRRAFVAEVLGYLDDGAQSLGELDFARLCRRRGLPVPTRQALVHGPRGRIYLDVRWEQHGLVVEIDGVQHREGLQVSADHLSRNEVALGRDRVLRIDLIGLRLRTEEFLDQVERGLARPAISLVRGIRSPADAR